MQHGSYHEKNPYITIKRGSIFTIQQKKIENFSLVLLKKLTIIVLLLIIFCYNSFQFLITNNEF